MDSAANHIANTLPALLEALQASDIIELEIHEGEIRLRVHRSRLQGTMPLMDLESQIPEPAEIEVGLIEVVSPLVGTFYRAGQPGTPPLVQEGSVVENHSVVGIIEALHVLTEIEAGVSGTVVSALATDGQPVEYGQVLFLIEPRG